ncbi:MAG: hypothetical protein JSU68_14035 [Phycisphaerales bacterium]|nr:MAG: hypothetical protein JSU68_14035 [Phycisphaerales bacterium]
MTIVFASYVLFMLLLSVEGLISPDGVPFDRSGLGQMWNLTKWWLISIVGVGIVLGWLNGLLMEPHHCVVGLCLASFSNLILCVGRFWFPAFLVHYVAYNTLLWAYLRRRTDRPIVSALVALEIAPFSLAFTYITALQQNLPGFDAYFSTSLRASITVSATLAAVIASFCVVEWKSFRCPGHPDGHTLCPHCGYDLYRNITGECPECGRPTSGDEPPNIWG